jgi:hypothetical protein
MSGRPDRRRRHVLSARARTGLWVGGTILAATVVILVFGALSTPKPADESAPGTATVPGLSAYTDGMTALAAGETTKAVALLKSAADAGNAAARDRLAEIEGTSPSKPGAPPTDDTTSTPAVDTVAMLPSAMTGYTTTKVEKNPTGAIVAFQPTYAGPYGKVSLVVMSVLDKGTDAQALGYVDQIGLAFPANAEAVTIGTQQARFGTDGSHLASVVFSRGRYVFEVVATASRPDPLKIRDITIAAATAFPAAR